MATETTPNKLTQALNAQSILFQIIEELGLVNVKCFGFQKGKWLVRYHRGKQNKFDSFDDMYQFLKTESTQ